MTERQAAVRTIVLATNNAHKVSEISTALNFEGWEFKTLRELGIHSEPDEDANTFEGNALIKAMAAREASGGLAALADDSGLEVDALDGAPGVYSARYAEDEIDAQTGLTAEGLPIDSANNKKLLREMADVPDDKRTARFVCTLVFIEEDGAKHVARGTIEGRIGYDERGDEGFGYDPLFYPDEFHGEKTLAEVSQTEKNAISHRGNALRALKRELD